MESLKYEWEGFSCNHLKKYHPDLAVRVIFGISVRQIHYGEVNLTVGTEVECLASKEYGGVCSHDCQKARITRREWFFNDIEPVEATLDHKRCQYIESIL